jgi:cobalt/nickel transport system ATP-binding protein
MVNFHVQFGRMSGDNGMDQNNNVIELENIFFAYAHDREVFNGLNFRLSKGEKVGIIGHNGSGKTTMLHILMGLLRPVKGRVKLFGKPVKTENEFRAARRDAGFLFQNADDQLFCPTVLEDVAFGPLNLGKSPEEAKKMSREVLADLNLKGFEDRVTHKLSGGEKKMVALATILVMQPKVLLMDEPTSGLDAKTISRIMNILNHLDISYVIASHEYDFLSRTTTDIFRMSQGRIEYDGPSKNLHSHYHRHPMGEAAHEHK